MTERTVSGSRAGLWLTAMVSIVAALVTMGMSLSRPSVVGIPSLTVGEAIFLVAQVAFVLIGLVVVKHNKIVGLLLCAAGFIPQAANLAREYALAGSLREGGLPLFREIALFSAVIEQVVAVAFASFLFRFPNGSLPSPSWRYPAMLPVIGLLPLTIGGALAWPHRGVAVLSDGLLPGAAGVVMEVGFMFMTLGIVFGVVSIFARYRTSSHIERQQIKWVGYVCLLATLTVGVQIVGGRDELATVLGALAVLLIPAAIAVALLRYRLYDVDLVINRTLVYAVLTAGLGAVYVGGVTLARAVLPVGSSDLGVAVSTLAVAALFTPARRRVQGAIDQLFYRRRYDAARTVSSFAAHLRNEVDLGAVSDDLLVAVRETMQPRTASLWLPNDGASS